MYKIIATISLIIRQLVLPNPFECFGFFEGIIINLIAEPIIHIVAFVLVGLFYMKGSAPAWGSFLYLVTYSAITLVLYVMSIFKFIWWWVICVILMLIATPFVIKFIFWGLGEIFNLIIDCIVCLFKKIKQKREKGEK